MNEFDFNKILDTNASKELKMVYVGQNSKLRKNEKDSNQTNSVSKYGLSDSRTAETMVKDMKKGVPGASNPDKKSYTNKVVSEKKNMKAVLTKLQFNKCELSSDDDDEDVENMAYPITPSV